MNQDVTPTSGETPSKKVEKTSNSEVVESVEIVTPENELSEVKLNDLPESVQNAAANVGWKTLTKVQSLAIPYLLEGRDIMVQSHTGSGKTGAFILPMIQRLDGNLKKCQALILVPTRELAVQVCNEAEKLLKDHKLEAVPVYGGVSYKPQMEAFKRGAQLVIGTPGRILDHLMSKNLDLSALKMLILDEADRMLSMGFYPDMKKLRNFLPQKPRSSYLFSATYPVRVVSISRIFLNNPDMLSLSQGQVHAMLTNHCFYRVPPMQKDRTLARLIEFENPASGIIFCNTKARVHYITEVLKRFGYDADEITAELSQSKRESVLGRIKSGKLKFLVATDIAGRGIDISELSHVFHYEPPEDPEAYIHRSGRTGRAGATGKVITLTEGYEAIELKKIAKKFGIELEECDVPDDETIEKIVHERTIAMLDAKMRNRDNLQKERMARFNSLAKTISSNEDQLHLVAMLLDDYYHEQMHKAAIEEEEVSKITENTSNDAKNTNKKRHRRRKPSYDKSRKH